MRCQNFQIFQFPITYISCKPSPVRYVAAKQQKTEDFSDVCAREEAAGHRKRQCVCCEILCFKPKEGTSLKKIGGTEEAKDDLEGSPTEPRKETSQVPENEHLPAVPGAVEP